MLVILHYQIHEASNRSPERGSLCHLHNVNNEAAENADSGLKILDIVRKPNSVNTFFFNIYSAKIVSYATKSITHINLYFSLKFY